MLYMVHIVGGGPISKDGLNIVGYFRHLGQSMIEID